MTATKVQHDSDCAQHNEPAYPNGPCDCSVSGGSLPPAAPSSVPSGDVDGGAGR